jgi:hypothetical protein
MSMHFFEHFYSHQISYACAMHELCIHNREGAARAQYMCSLVQRSAGSCIDGFTAGRDERMISRATLLTEQVTTVK